MYYFAFFDYYFQETVKFLETGPMFCSSLNASMNKTGIQLL